jgi:hypothetical protein
MVNVGSKKARPTRRSETRREPIAEPQKQGSFPASGPVIFYSFLRFLAPLYLQGPFGTAEGR